MFIDFNKIIGVFFGLNCEMFYDIVLFVGVVTEYGQEHSGLLGRHRSSGRVDA